MAEKKKRKGLKIFAIILAVIVLLGAVTAVMNVVSKNANIKLAGAYSKIEYKNQLVPELDASGDWCFTAERDFRVMQLTDIHFGGGWMSASKDSSAIAAVAAMIPAEKPDLVVVTGDIAFPVPFSAGTLNNKFGAEILIELMESLGVYWTVSFGNHDSEIYSYYSREEVSEFYSDPELKYCLYQPGPDNVDGYGNQVIKVKNAQGAITQSVFLFDSHSYTDGDYFGILWKYDSIHQNQIDWYKNTVRAINAYNISLGKAGEGVKMKSVAFMHIPIEEYRTAWEDFSGNGYKDTENTKYKYGIVGETGRMIYCSQYETELFETMEALGSTQGVFCGHDHYNNFSVNYKGIDLTYSYSVDYLAYSGVNKLGSQRGCTVISLSPDGTYRFEKYNLYESGRYNLSDELTEDVSMQFSDVEYQYIEEE